MKKKGRFAGGDSSGIVFLKNLKLLHKNRHSTKSVKLKPTNNNKKKKRHRTNCRV